jgi:hypothetical protein
MKAVIVATDFLKDTDGNFKILELNTNVGNVISDANNYFDIEEFNQFVVSNGIEVIEFINQSMGMSDLAIDVEMTESSIPKPFNMLLSEYYSGSTTVSVTLHNVEATSTTIPFIEDAPNKLILRNAYDSTALIDDTYTKDNFEFLKLMYDTDTNSIPKTYFVNDTLGIDSIGEDIRNNGEYPNFIVKERYPTTNYQQYPKIYKITSIEELSNLKSSLPSNTLLQEYIINVDDLLDNKLKTYRSVDIIYGPNLEVMNLFSPYVHTNSTILSPSADFDNNNELQYWERPVYLQKVGNINDTVRLKNYKVDADSKILDGDGFLKNINDIVIGNTLKSIQLNNLGWNDNDAPIYSASVADVTIGSSVINTNVTGIESFEETSFWLKEITLNDGTIFSDVDSSSVIAKVFGYTDEMFRFTQFKLLNVNDSIIVVNTTTNELEIKTISSIKYSYNKETIYKLEVEESDLYLTMEEETTSPIYALIQHNVYGSCQNNCCNYAYWTCYSPCGGSYSYDGYAYNVGVCCPDGFFYCYSYDYYYSMCPYCCDQVFCGGGVK